MNPYELMTIIIWIQSENSVQQDIKHKIYTFLNFNTTFVIINPYQVVES